MNSKSISHDSIKKLALVAAVSSVVPVMAEYDPGQGGWTELINCLNTSWDVCPIYHNKFYWGGSGPDLTYISPEGWWTYAEPDVGSFDCGQWVNGSIVGGATYEDGQPSVSQGVDVNINTYWWDFTNADYFTACSHMHTSTYVWGWRYNGSSWMREFVTAHTLSAHLNDQGVCVFKGDNHPDFPQGGLIEGLAFGPQTLSIKNSPYAVLYTKSQANSHFNAGCGEQECFHRVRVRVNYKGGPGPNKGKLRFDPPSNDLTLEGRSDNTFNPDSFSATPSNVKIESQGVQENLKMIR